MFLRLVEEKPKNQHVKNVQRFIFKSTAEEFTANVIGRLYRFKTIGLPTRFLFLVNNNSSYEIHIFNFKT